MKKRKIGNFVPILITAVCLCFVVWSELHVPASDSEEIETLVQVQEETQAKGIDIPYEWKEQVNERNVINAVIEVPDIIRQEGFQSVKATKKEIDLAKLLKLLEEDYQPYKGMEDDLDIQFLGNDEMYLYYHKTYSDINMICKMDDYIRMAYRDQLSASYNRDKYFVDTNVEGFPMEECDDRIHGFMEALGIQGEYQIVHRALDYRIMKEEAIELHQDGAITKPDYDWQEKDNSYHCSVSQLCNGIPVLESYRLRGRNDILNQASHIFVLNKDRFISFSTDKVFDFAYGKEYKKLLPFSEIMNKYREASELELRSTNIEVTHIAMRIIAIETGEGQYFMQPVWIFDGSEAYDTVPGTYPYVMIVNAFTGEEM